MSTLLEVAENTGLNMVRFRQDLTDHRLLAKLAEDHTFAVSMLGVFGTPTLVFDKSRAIFLKMDEPPPPEECLSLFAELRRFAQEKWYIQEIKRPQL